MRQRVFVALAIMMLGVTSTALSAWTAYNDCAWDPGQTTNNITTNGASTTGASVMFNLRNYSGGTSIAAQATFSGASVQYFTFNTGFQIATPATNSDAYQIFQGKVAYASSNYCNWSSTGATVTLTFTGLMPAKTYSFALFSTRGTNGGTYADRWTDITISDVDSFTNNSSAGVTKFQKTASNDSARITADNMTGRVFRYDGITPGLDGDIRFDIMCNGTNGSAIAYINAFMLQEFDEAASPPLIANVPATVLSWTSAVLSASVISTGVLPTSVWLYWQTGSDAGTNKSSWANVVPLGIRPVSSVSNTLQTLAINTTYAYRFYASNAMGEAWGSPAESFTTLNYVAPTTPDVSYTGKDDPEIQWLLDHVPHFKVVTLPVSTGTVTVSSEMSYTVEDLRGLQFDSNPSYFPATNVWPGTAGDGLPVGTGPYVSPNLAPFMLKYFTNEFAYCGSWNGNIQDYAAIHGYRVNYENYAGSANSVPTGSQKIRWGTFTDILGYCDANGITRGRWDLFYNFAHQPGKDIVDDFVRGTNGTSAAWGYVSDSTIAMVDLEYYETAWNAWEGVSLFSPGTLRTRSYYPTNGTPTEKADFEKRYYEGFALALMAPAQALKRNGWKSAGLYSEPFDPETYRLSYSYNGSMLWDDAMVKGLPDPATCWHWQAFTRMVAEGQDVLYPDVYVAYAGVNNIGFILAKVDYMQNLLRTIPGGKANRPYIWPHLHGGDGNQTWWNQMPMIPEDMRAMAAMVPMSGANGHAIWEFNRYNYHDVTPLWLDGWQSFAGINTVSGGTGNNVTVGMPFSLWPQGANTNTTAATNFYRYDVLSITSTNVDGQGTCEFQHHPFNLFSQPGGNGANTASQFAQPAVTGRPTYRISRTLLTNSLMRESESLRGSFEGLAVLKPIEGLVHRGSPVIETPALYQFMEWLPSVRRVRTEQYDIFATYDPGVVRRRVAKNVIVSNFNGRAGHNLVLPADDQLRVYVIARDSASVSASVSSTNDDGEEAANGTVSLTATSLNAGNGSVTALRFSGVNLPQGVSIRSATLTLTSSVMQTNGGSLTIYGESADQSQALSTNNGAIRARSSTQASVDWVPDAWGVNQLVTSPDLAAVLHEIVSRSGWQASNALTLFVSGSGGRSVFARENGSASAATLTVEYVPAPSATTGPVSNYGTNSVTITGKLHSTNGLPTSIYVYWGTNDPGVAKDLWEHVTPLGSLPEGSFAGVLSGLSPFTEYQYRVYASNSLADAWGETRSCRTLTSSGSWGLDLPVQVGADDAEEFTNGVVSLSSSDLELTYDEFVSAPRPCFQTTGIRFEPVTVPQGATVTAAWIQFTVAETNTIMGAPLLVSAQATDTAPSIVSTTGNISTRTLTTANVSWSPAPWTNAGAAGVDQRTPDLKTVVQEVFQRPGWTSGSAVMFVITGGGKHNVVSKDGNSGLNPPILHLEWTGGAQHEAWSGRVTDDAEEYVGGEISRESPDIELVRDIATSAPRPCDQVIGLRFGSVDIPYRAGINKAWLQFTSAEVCTGTVSLFVSGLAADNSSTILTNGFDVSDRLRTTAMVPWSPADWTTVDEAGAAERSPDLKDIVQEIVNRPGWQEGNALGFVVTGTGRRNAYSTEGSTTKSAMLYVDWTAPAASPVDADGDGMADAWELAKLGGTNSLPSGDADGDGESNLREFIAGTSPTGSSDAFAISVTMINGQVVVTYPKEQAVGSGYDGLDRYYSLERILRLSQGGWTSVNGFDDEFGTTGTGRFTNSVPYSNAFYRVKVRLE